MPDIITRQVDRGFNATVNDATELQRGSAADGSQNVLYSRGIIKTPYGFSQLGSALDSGNEVLGMTVYSELDKTQHFVAVTVNKMYDYNYNTAAWADITQDSVDFGANADNPVSFAGVLHTDNIPIDSGSRAWYHHLCVSNGGLTSVQRWAGKHEADFADLVGGDDYHHADSEQTTHYCDQLGSFFNRLLLINPKEADANNNLINNNQRIRWPQAGKLEIWSGSGSGAVDLLDTGGYNVWGALLGKQWIQYQNNSVWSLTHVGGTRVYEPDIELPKLGLLAPHLLYAKNNVHYFVGNDYNIYKYYGGSNLEKIGYDIRKYLQRDLAREYAKRCWLTIGAENSRLWLFIVPTDKTFVTQAYGIDIRTGVWMKRDYTHKWSTGGISSVGLIGASSFQSGQTYAEEVISGATYADYAALSADTERAGKTYAEAIETVLTNETMVLGDSNGEVFQFDSDVTTDDTVDVPAVHITEVYDLDRPYENKIWPSIKYNAKGTGIIVSYRTGNFETTGTGWTAFSEQVLTSEWTLYEEFLNVTSKKIQFRFTNADGDDFQVSNYAVTEAVLEGSI